MENKINIAELLKDCPKGMELDCTMYDNLSYDYIDKEQNRIYCKVDLRDTVWFTIYGCVNLSPSAKCVIFPKGKTSWEGFQRQFKDGDVVATNSGAWIGITTGGKIYSFIPTYCVIKGNGEFEAYFDEKEKWQFNRLATEVEKEKLFNAVKANGYKWNAETKTLEKLVEPRFKVGDRIKFRYFDRKNAKIVKIHDERYELDNGKFIEFQDENAYEISYDKFDFTDLKPFESRVLVRDYDNQMWMPTFWGKRLEDDSNCSYLTTNGCYKYCIPYDVNKELLGTTDDCDEFYKTW